MLKINSIPLLLLLISCQNQLINTISHDKIEVLSSFYRPICKQEITILKDQESLINFQKDIKSNYKSGPLFIIDFDQYYVIAICKKSIGAYEVESIDQYKKNNVLILSKKIKESQENILLIKVPNTIEEINLKLKK